MLQRLRCWLYYGHEWVWLRGIYGDEINARNGKRHVWRCSHCGATKEG